MKTLLRYVFLLALVGTFLVLPGAHSPLFAQATSVAQISGVVTDPSGARVAGAEVRATQTSTGFARSAVSGPQGTYVLVNLPVGPYELQVSAPGFRTYIQRGIVLQVNDHITQDVSLELGAVAQTIEVTSGGGMVQLQTTSISQVIERQRVEDLPLNGRDPTQLILLSGAAVVAPPAALDLTSSKNYPTSQAISVAGGQANGTYYLLDGGDHNDPFGNVNMPLPFPDALQEFSVQTSTISPQYGGHPGAVVNAVTKSGTNKLHGNVFEFLRNGATNARNFFAAAKDTLKRNQFGGTVGGPIKKDKLFFFAGYQGTRQRTAPPTSTSFVPTAAVLAGDLSTITSSACGPARTITDPETGQPFPGDFIDPARFNASALAVLQNVPVSSDPCGRIQVAVPNPLDEDQFVARIDWYKGEKHFVFGRYFLANVRNPAVFDGSNILLSNRFGIADQADTLTLGYDYSVSPTVLNSLRVTLARDLVNRKPAEGLPTAADYGIDISPSPGNTPYIGVSGYFATSCGVCSLAQIHNAYGQVADDVTWTRGRHQITFGGTYIRRQENWNFTTATAGSFSFNGSFTGVSLADFLLGLPVSFSNANVLPWWGDENILGMYVNDNIRATSRLTLIAGLRWQPYFPARDRVGRATYFDRAGFSAGLQSGVFDNAPPGMLFPGDRTLGGEVVPDAGFHGQTGNFAPRLGLAWDPTGTGKWSVRSSYGIFYELAPLQRYTRLGQSPPWGSTIGITSPTGGFSQPYLDYPGGNPFPIPAPPPKDVFFVSPGNYIFFGLHTNTPYTQQWSFSVQRQAGANWLFSANYMGNKATHRWLNRHWNPAIYIPGQSTVANTASRRELTLEDPVGGPAINTLYGNDDGGNNSYQGLYLSANHRLTHNFSILANYTWAHCIGDGWTRPGIIGASNQDPYDRRGGRGNCVYDVRQLFNLSFLLATPRFNGVVQRRLLGGWRFGGIITKRSGFWNNPATGVDASLTGVGADRPDVNGDPKLSNPTVEKWFDTSVYTRNEPGTYGTAGAFSIAGPGAFTFDAMLTREFRFTESQRLEIRVESFNVLNHPVFDAPVSAHNNANFGKILSARDPRIWQFALKYVF